MDVEKEFQLMKGNTTRVGFTNTSNMEDEIIKMLKDLQISIVKKKENLLNERMLERTKFIVDLSLEQEMKKKFPRLICVSDKIQGVERWYWNDGTEDGILLITFFPIEIIKFVGNGFEVSLNFSYI